MPKSDSEWQLWKHRGDESVLYEARKISGAQYELRRPKDGLALGTIDAQYWEQIYERRGES